MYWYMCTNFMCMCMYMCVLMYYIYHMLCLNIYSFFSSFKLKYNKKNMLLKNLINILNNKLMKTKYLILLKVKFIYYYNLISTNTK